MYLIDTNIVSELARREPDANVLAWAGTVSAFRLSVVTLEEIAFGLARCPKPRIQGWMADFFARNPALAVTPDIAQRAGDLRGQLAQQGQVRHQADMLIAATALAHKLILVTRNTADFDGCGLTIHNPFA